MRAKILAVLAASLMTLSPTGPAWAQVEVPDQAWYPPGYHDLRVAAAKQLEDFPRISEVILMEDWDDPELSTYDLIDCNLAYDLPWEMEDRLRMQSELALDIARMRSEFRELGYRREVYDEPLLAYERAALQAIEVEPDAWHWDREVPYVAEDDGFPDPPATIGSRDIDYDLLENLESRRQRLDPKKPRFVMEGGCGAGEEEFEIKLVPANGELWLINAFAFRVCERKVPNPWDHDACSWTQYSSGEAAFASGRYMYEARWPNGTVKRGAKVLDSGQADDGLAITFRRN